MSVLRELLDMEIIRDHRSLDTDIRHHSGVSLSHCDRPILDKMDCQLYTAEGQGSGPEFIRQAR
jgi:hypothetical protein